jgi:hypothetical protein
MAYLINNVTVFVSGLGVTCIAVGNTVGKYSDIPLLTTDSISKLNSSVILLNINSLNGLPKDGFKYLSLTPVRK